MFTHNINPVFFSVGSFQVKYYALAYIITFIVMQFVFVYIANKKLVKNLDEKNANSLVLILAIAVFLGGRIGFLLAYNPAILLTDPLEIFRVWNGGISAHGCILSSVIAIYFFCKSKKINFLEIMDVISVITFLSTTLVRIGNFINAELYGVKTDLPWCVKFPGVEDCRHPYQLYMSITHAISFAVLFIAYKKTKKSESYVPGIIFYHALWIYGATRLVLDFFRDENRIFLNLSVGQIASLIMIIIGIALLVKTRNDKNKNGVSNGEKL